MFLYLYLFNISMYEYCIEKKLLFNETSIIFVLNDKTHKLLTDFETDIKNTEVIKMSLCDILLSKQQPRTILLIKLLFDIIEIWIPTYRFFSNKNKTLFSNDIIKKIQMIHFQF